MSILPELFDGRERAGEAQGCCMMGGNDISHDCNTPGSPDQRGNHPISQGARYPKGMGRGNVLGQRSITPGPGEARGVFYTAFISPLCTKTP